MLSYLLSHLFIVEKQHPIETIMKMEFTVEGRNTDAAGK